MKVKMNLLFITCAFMLGACSSEENVISEEEQAHEMEHKHNFNGLAEVSEALAQKAVAEPKYPIGSQALSKAKHMGGMMDGVDVTIVAAYQTTAYETTFVMDDGTKMEKHRWIVHEELVDPSEEPVPVGTEIKTTADHMEGMKGSIQTIDSSVATTVYIVNFETKDEHQVKNHK